MNVWYHRVKLSFAGRNILANSDDYIIASVVRAVRTLKQFTADTPTHSLMDLAKRCSVNKSSMFRILATLESEGFVRQNENKKYELGIDLYHLVNSAYGFLDIKKICAPYLRTACEKSNLLIHLAIIDDNKIIIIDRIWPRNDFEAVVLASNVGGTVPLHSTGVGKVLCAYSPGIIREKLIGACDFKKFSERTITDRDEFLGALDVVRKNGYAINEGEHEPYLKCLTRPIFNADGKIIAAFSLSGLREVLNGEGLENAQQVSEETAILINKEFGWHLRVG